MRLLRDLWHMLRGLPSSFRDARKVLKQQRRLPYWERREPKGERRPVRVGIVGAGRYAQYHLEVLSSLENVEIHSICTRGGPRAQEVAGRFRIPRVLTDIDAFTAQSDVDAFLVVVPIPETKAVALKCLGTGKPVLLEKPAGLSSAETAELVAQAEKHRTYGMVGMNRRFYSVVEHGLAALATCGPLRGAILEVPEDISDRRRQKSLPEQAYDRWMFAQSIHGIDLLRYVLGNVEKVHGIAKPNEAVRNEAASFVSAVEFEGNLMGSVVALWDTLPRWRLKVIAERGWVELEPLEQGWFVNARGYRIPIRPDPIDTEFRTGLYAQDLHFIRAVRDGKRPALPASLLPDAYKLNRLVEQILGSG